MKFLEETSWSYACNLQRFCDAAVPSKFDHHHKYKFPANRGGVLMSHSTGIIDCGVQISSSLLKIK